MAQGKTKDDAKQSALRNAIEQAFGTFISSKTDILNDELIKDEIVSVSNGNIQKFEVLTEGRLPDGNYYNTMKATVSVSKLTSFCESKGISVEFKGALFSFNIKQQKINEENELKAIQDMSFMLKKIIDKSFDFKISATQPVSINGSNDMWSIPIQIGVSVNNNFFQIPQILCRTLSGLSLSEKEAENYINLKKPIFTILIASPEYEDGQAYFLRNVHSVESLYSIFVYFASPIFFATISNGVANFSLADILKSENDSHNVLHSYYEIKSDVHKFSPCLTYVRSIHPLQFYDIMGNQTPQFYCYLPPYESYAKNITSDDRYSYLYDLVDDITVKGIRIKNLGNPEPIYLIASFLQIEKNDYESY